MDCAVAEHLAEKKLASSILCIDHCTRANSITPKTKARKTGAKIAISIAVAPSLFAANFLKCGMCESMLYWSLTIVTESILAGGLTDDFKIRGVSTDVSIVK